jgi:hypothetical protein
MDASELIGLVSAGPNAAVVAAVGGDASWNVADDWGLDGEWQVVRVPVGIKFRRSTNGLVSEEVLVARGGDRDTHERLLSLSRIPTHLVLVDRPQVPHNRMAPHFLYPPVASDG